MAILELQPPQPPPPPQNEGAVDGVDPFDMPILLEQLQDDLARSRKREAFWMSLFLHALVIIAIFTSPTWTAKLAAWFPARAVLVATPQELIQQKELTYLNAPSVDQKLNERPKTDVISDKDRVATSRRPQLDRHELKKILDSGLQGAPGPMVPPGPPAQQPMAQMQQGARGQQSQGQAPPPPPNQSAKLQPAPNPFAGAGAMSAGSAIEQAARAAAANRGGGYGGGGGDYGMSTGGAGKIKSDMDILSDTMGVDFGPYLQRVLHDVRTNWYNLIPEAARAPLLRKGKVSIEFAITKDGSVAGLRIVGQSGDVSLDRAALGGIMGSNPFPPLPGEFRGSYLALRFHFYYNPDKSDLLQ
jgi:TonB family protein